MRRSLFAAIALTLAATVSGAEDWPQFRFDAARSGYTSEDLPSDLTLRWVHKPRQPPDPAWVGQDTRLPFDHAYHVVVSRGSVFFGSSADCKVYALDAATGLERWSSYTEAPVRFAPAVWEGRVYVASDDGSLYCFEAETGQLAWRRPVAPGRDMLLGNGRLISRWPVRGAPAIADDVLYVAAGIWPSEGIYIQALNPETGDPIWLDDLAGYIEMDQPHGGARAKSGLSAQGYLTVAGDALLIPTGRATPAVLDRADGRLRYFHLQEYSGRGGGPYVTAVGDWHFSELDAFLTDDGRRLARGIPSIAMAAHPEWVIYAQGQEIKGVGRERLFVEKDGVDKRGNPIKTHALSGHEWVIACPGAVGRSLIGAGNTVSAGVIGGAGGSASHQVVVADIPRREVVSVLDVDGLPLGLAAADGRLYVSTDKGTIHCFAAGGEGPGAVREQPASTPDAPPSSTDETYAGAAEEIIRQTGVTKGYCVDMGCGDGSLAHELARRTDLCIYALTPDPTMASAARERLTAAGLYGTRVTVLERDLSDTELPNFMANLVVSAESVRTGRAPGSPEERRRLQRPYDGAVCLGKPGKMNVAKRGPLEGAGEWTHQYASAANPGASTDEVVRGPLGMLWFADNTLEMPSRHGRGPSPLFWNGFLFVEGIDGLRAFDAYNGTLIWEYPLPGILKAYDQEHLNGVAITGSNICIADGSLYVRVDDRCLRLDAMTGGMIAEFRAPPKPDGGAGKWGYIACDDGILFGSAYNEEHQVVYAFGKSDMSRLFSESVLLFALDAKTGEPKWTYEPEASIRSNTVAVGSGRVFLIDRPLAVRDRSKDDKTEHPPGKLVALDARTGDVLWTAADDIHGTMLALSEEHNVLLMAYQATRFKLNSELGGRLTAFGALDGARLWDVKEPYATRPLISGRTIYAQPGAWDLLTGARRDFNFTRSYGCGILAGSKHLLAYRSATLGYWDLTSSHGTENYGGIRPGCWINALPVGGLLLVPEASNRCRCSYLIKATIALQQHGVRAPTIVPAAASSNQPINVTLAAESPRAEIRYTLDGSSPTQRSPRYSGPIEISETCELSARVFHDGVPGPVSTGKLTIDPDIIPLAGEAWQVHDTPGGGPPNSNWVVADGIATELSNHYKGSASEPDPAMERPGTFRAYGPGASFADGELALDIASADDDGIGVAFRFQDPQRHYLFSMDKQRAFRILARKSGDAYEVLAQNAKGYRANRWYEVRIVLQGAKISVYVDGELDLEVVDETFPKGAFALYSWGSTGAKFRNVKWRSAE